VFSRANMKRPSLRLGVSENRFLQMGCAMNKDGEGIVNVEMKRLKFQVAELKDLVNTLLSVICEEADGVADGSAPSIPGGPKMNYCM